MNINRNNLEEKYALNTSKTLFTYFRKNIVYISIRTKSSMPDARLVNDI